MANKQPHVVNIPMDSATYTKLAEMARHNERSRSAEVRFLIQQAVPTTPAQAFDATKQRSAADLQGVIQ